MSFFFFGLLLTNLGDKILSKYLEEDWIIVRLLNEKDYRLECNWFKTYEMT